MKSTTAALLVFNLMTLGATHAFAANIADVAEDRAEAKYDATKSDAKHQYEAAEANCRNLAGNSRDVCMKEAKATYKTDSAHAKATEKSETDSPKIKTVVPFFLSPFAIIRVLPR